MLLKWLVAATHLFALAFGWAAIVGRARALKGPLDDKGIREVLSADTRWGVAAILWIGTGLWRAFGGLEKGSEYYLANHVFWFKMACLLAIIALELKPATTLTGWRTALRKQQIPDTSQAPLLSRISSAQVGLTLLMVLAATAMARGIGMR
jgi:putative membrane protein